MLLSAAARWPVTALSPVHALTRDLLLPLLWVLGFSDRGFVWRGNAMSVDEDEPVEAI